MSITFEEVGNMKFDDVIVLIQSEVRSIKDQTASAGARYNYRSLEGILEDVKPTLKKYRTSISFDGRVEFLEGRFFQVATAKLTFGPTGEVRSAEEWVEMLGDEAKAMSKPQRSGANASYGKKYAACSILALDDNDDPDSDDFKVKNEMVVTETKEAEAPRKISNPNAKATAAQVKALKDMIKDRDVLLSDFDDVPATVEELTKGRASQLFDELKALPKAEKPSKGRPDF